MLLDSEFSSFFQFLQWGDKLSEPESLDGQQQETVAEPKTVVAEPESPNENSHLFAVKTTGGQEKIVMRLLEARIKLDHKNEEEIEKAKEEGKEIKIDEAFPRVKNIQSVVLLSDLKGYVVIEALEIGRASCRERV